MVSHFPSLAGLLASRLLSLPCPWLLRLSRPRIAYVWGIASGSLLTKASPASKFAGGSISLPLDGCRMCGVLAVLFVGPCLTWSFRAGLFCRAVPDMVIPFMFAVVVITSVVGFTAAVGVWEDDNEVLR
ncbi:hypothetical protein VPH35_058055 [Triticum aestivum]